VKGIADTGFLVAFANRNDTHHAWAVTVAGGVTEPLLTHTSELAKLAERYANRSPDLADLCLIRMSELFPRHSVITVDRTDFRIYRRNRREAIPLICPP
jgi:predicted nucleic acid-binding protein